MTRYLYSCFADNDERIRHYKIITFSSSIRIVSISYYYGVKWLLNIKIQHPVTTIFKLCVFNNTNTNTGYL